MDKNKKPKLEDLLKVKKAEQPSDAFWENFDRELQEKALLTFIQKEPWYDNCASWFIRHIRSTSMAYSLVCFIGIALYLNFGFVGSSLVSHINSNSQSIIAFEKMAGSELADNGILEKDYAVEVIAINGASETYDFEADLISVAIGDTADYSDAPVYASSDTLKKSNPYTQLANFAF